MSAPAATLARAQAALQAGRRMRIVRQARLRPAREEDAAQMRFALEDALNTAEFNDCGRLVVVKRLRLQGLPPRAGTAVMARAIEEAWRVAARAAVPAASPEAEGGQADAVYFASRFDARAQWLERVAAGRVVQGWHWRAALPELDDVGLVGEHGAGRVDGVLMAMLIDSPRETVAVLRRWDDTQWRALAQHVGREAGEALFEALTRDAGSSWLGSTPGVVLGSRRHTGAPAVAPAVVQKVTRVMSQWHGQPAWVAALLLAREEGVIPSRERVQVVLREAEAVLSGGDELERHAPVNGLIPTDAVIHSPNRETHSMVGAAGMPRAVPSGGDPAARRLDEVSFAVAGSDVARPTLLRMEDPLAPPSTRVTARRRVMPSPFPWLDDAQATSHGGLLLVINLLQALRFDAWLQANPQDEDFVARLFMHLLRCAGASRGDPQWSWFLPQDGATSPALRLWTLRLRRVLRRHVRMDLAELVRRTAWVSATPTHIDVIYPLDEVELRLRRHGLDSDPGWVPWFGRIVNFHFLLRELLPKEPQDG